MVAQKEVIRKLMGQLEWIEQGIISERPLGVWLFLGNQGVGKKTLIHQFNRLYFNQEDMVELDMAALEHNLDHNLSKLCLLYTSPYRALSESDHPAADTPAFSAAG